MGSNVFLLRRGNSYRITLQHLGTKPELSEPDYDWQAQINGLPTTTVLAGGQTHADANRYFVVDDEIIVDNLDGLLGVVNQSFGPEDFTLGKEARLYIPRIEMYMDSNRDGSVDPTRGGPDDLDKDVWEYGAAASGAIIWFNNDDDDGNGVDAFDEIVNGVADIDDLAPLLIAKTGADLPEGWTLQLVVTQSVDKIRVFDELAVTASAIISPTNPVANIPALDITGTGNPLEFGIEAVAYPGWPDPDFDGLVTIALHVVDTTNVVRTKSDIIQMRVAPWMMPSHLDEVITVYVTDPIGARSTNHPAGPAEPFTNRLAAALGFQPHVIPSSDMWPQDQYEIGFHSAPGGQWQTSLLNSPRQRSNLPEYALNTLLDADFGIMGVGSNVWHSQPLWQNTHDSFGNLEVFPPLSGHPNGLVYHGEEQTDSAGWFAASGGAFVNGVKSELVHFLASQKIQGNPPLQVDADWLVVKHVDEFISVQATGSNTFRVILASPQMGVDILEGLAATNFVFQHGQLWDPFEDRTAAELLAAPDQTNPTATVKAYNEGLQTIINAKRAALEAHGITDFVNVPAYFISRDWSQAGGPLSATGVAQSMLPDMVNMLNVNGTLIVPDPNPHPGINWPGGEGDPFKQAFEAAIGGGTTVEWIDCMEYHYGVGEVHCATNVRRVPRDGIQHWWLVEP